MLAKYLVPALAVLGAVSAQSSTTTASACSQPTATINSQADATALASSCSTVSGDVLIASSASGTIALDGINQIVGNLIVNNATQLTGLTGSTLNSIGKSLTLTSLTILSNLGFPVLTSVGSIRWTTLNALQQLGFTQGLTKCSTLFITDTALTTLNGINLATVGNMEVTNNAFLRSISTQVANITQALTINNNGIGLNLTFPNLLFAYNITVRNVSSLSIPSLAAVNSTFGVYGSYMESILAPNLTTVGGDVAFVADSSLTNISMPALKTIGGGLLIANNTGLTNINGFPALTTTGAINLSGNFTNAVLPALSDVKGTFNAQSSGNFSCTPFQANKNNQVIKGTFFCKAQSNNVQTTATTTSDPNAPASATGTQGAAAFVEARGTVVVGLTAVVAAFFSLL